MKTYEVTWRGERWFVDATVTQTKVSIFNLRRSGQLRAETLEATGSEEELSPVGPKVQAGGREPGYAQVLTRRDISEEDRAALFAAVRRAAR